MPRTITAFAALLAVLSGGAVALEEPRHLDDAVKAQKRLVKARPNRTGAFNDLGNLLQLDGDLVGAEEAYRRAVEIDPAFTPALYNLALLLQQVGERKEAKRTLQQVLELEPRHAWGHFQMGRIFEHSRKYDKAAHHYTRAFVLEPGLMEIGRNPQILDTRLATRARAALTAYAERIERLESAPREYYNADRITRLLVPESRVDEAETAERGKGADSAEEPKSQRRQKRPKKGAGSSDAQSDTGSSPGR